jgi:hypothetical protein
MRCAGGAWFTPPNCVLEVKAAASHPPAFGVLCRVVAEFDKSLFGHVFKTKAFKGGGFSGKVKGLRQGRIAS